MIDFCLGGDNPEKLESLKSRIKNSGLPYKTYTSPKEFAHQVAQDLQGMMSILPSHFTEISSFAAAIEADFPHSESPSALDLENMLHDTYADIRSRVYIGRQEYFNRIDNYVRDEHSMPLVILGEVTDTSFLSRFHRVT